jgi:thiol-disulfide isomerase/thioredoxin
MLGNRSQRSWTGNVTWSVCSLALAVVAIAGVLSGCGKATQKLTTGDVDLSFSNSHGKDVSLKLPCSNNCPASLKGKVVLVNFWATWCEPCRGEIPSLIEFQKKYSDKGFTLLGVAMDDDGAKVVQPFVQKTKFDVNGEKMPMNYPIVIGNDSVADKFGGLIGYPTSVLLTRDGKVAKTIIGPISPEDFKDIQNLIGS